MNCWTVFIGIQNLNIRIKRKGVFLSNDNYANIFLNILIKNKKQVPEEYEIIGFDNTISKESIIPITTVAQNIQKIARSAVEELKEQIESKDSEKKSEIRHVIIDPQLIIRGTTGKNSYTAEQAGRNSFQKTDDPGEAGSSVFQILR